eukprot:381242-Prymnesium_polylepis.1
MKLVVEAACEVGAELVVTVAEAPAKMGKDPKWTIAGQLIDPATAEGEEPPEALASSEAPTFDGTDWVAKAVPAVVGVLALTVTLVDGKVEETASAN